MSGVYQDIDTHKTDIKEITQRGVSKRYTHATFPYALPHPLLLSLFSLSLFSLCVYVNYNFCLLLLDHVFFFFFFFARTENLLILFIFGIHQTWNGNGHQI